MDGRRFAKFVLKYIQKHGDVGDNDQASRLLSELNEEELKSLEPAPPAADVAEVSTDPDTGTSKVAVTGEELGA
jgi:hypothetical protein